MAVDVRVAAAHVISGLNRGQSLNQTLPIYQERVAPRDAALLQELCYGCARWQPRLQALTELLMDKPLKAKDADIAALVHLGLYQLSFTRIPDHAAITTCVEAAKKLKKHWASRLLNGVLRTYQRRREELEPQLAAEPIYQYAHPNWLIEQLAVSWPEHWRALLEQNNQHPPMTLRVNQRHLSRDAYLDQLNAAGVTASATRYSAHGITLQQPLDPQQLPGFSAGHVSVQDEAAQLAAQLLELAPGQRVLDACSAPGGKACHIAELEPDLCELTAIDIDETRMQRVQENLARLNLEARLITADIGDRDAWWDGELFQRILLDAPCSATGVIRRHPDIKLLRRPSDIAKLAALQSQLLRALWPTLAPGGRLVYATCSVMPQENELVVEQFLADTADADHELIDASWGLLRPFGRQLFPQPQGHDGFYYACLRKRG